MFIAIDFDGTCVKHVFPNVGEDIGAAPVLRDLVDAGHKLILNTMRSDNKKVKAKGGIYGEPGDYLTQAVNWFKAREIELYGINNNPTQKHWTESPKVYAEIYIDDSAIGCPLIHPEDPDEKPYVDWRKVRYELEERGLLWK